MFVVMFEVKLKAGCKEEYYRLGKSMREHISKQPGFLGGTSYTSKTDPDLEISINCWEDEASMAQWRDFAGHRICQQTGREKLFERYQITVSQVTRTYTDCDRAQAPDDSNRFLRISL